MPDAPTPPHDDELDALIERGRPRGQWDVDAMWSRLRDESVEASAAGRPIDPPALVPHRPSAPRLGRPAPRGIRGWVVGVIGTGAIAAAGLLWMGRGSGAPPVPSATGAAREYVTGRGEIARIDLSDGSQVTLAAQSRLRIPSTFGNGERRLWLVGEAIFEVKHDSTVPFTVRVGAAELTDIGTRFDVRGYDSTGAVAVAVIEGAVSVASRAAPTRTGSLVRAGSVGVEDAGSVSVTPTARLGSYFDWAERRLSFDDRPLDEVLVSLGRWYDLDIRADRPLRGRRVTAELTTREPSAMLEALANALDARVSRDGRVVMLTENPR